MKRKSIIQLLAILVIALTTSCGNNNTPKGKDPKKPDTPELPDHPKDPENPEKPTEDLYDLWLATGEGTSSTEKQDSHVVKKIPTLLEGEYDIIGKGAETLKSGITPLSSITRAITIVLAVLQMGTTLVSIRLLMLE